MGGNLPTSALRPPVRRGTRAVSVPLRWGNTPLDDAVQFNHLEVARLLRDYQESYTPSETRAEAAAEALSKENLESMV